MTTNQTTALPTVPAPTEDYEATVRVHAPADAVFDLLTTTEGLAAWWNPATGSGATGGELRFRMGAPEPLVIRVVEATRPASVRWSVTDCPFVPDWVGTEPTFTITPLGDGTTEVYFRHHGLTGALECIEECTRGWNHYLFTSLRDHLEQGQGSPVGSAGDRARRRVEGE